jgi:hypothetical protein
MKVAALLGWASLALLFAACAALFFMAGMWPLGLGASLGAALFAIRFYGCASGKTAKLVATRKERATA